MDFDNNRPIYLQIADILSRRVLCGELDEGARIPSVREYGAEIGVNPNTVARSYDALTERGIIYNKRGIGFFVSDDAKTLVRDYMRKTFLEEELPAFIEKAELLNVNLKELI